MDDLTVKLTDHALSRELFPQDYDCLPGDSSNETRPLKFMAIESITDRRFSTASDAVSLVFCCLWLDCFNYTFLFLVVIWCSSLGIDESWCTTLR